MNSREAIRAASEAGTLLKVIAATPYDEFDTVADLLAALHNSGEIDLLTACDKPGLDAIPTHPFFNIQRVFCRALPKLQCSTKCATAACERMFQRAGTNMAASVVFDALVKWFEQSPERVAEGLEQIDQDAATSPAVVNSVLMGGVPQDAPKSTRDALDLSNRASPTVRLPALAALARTVPDDDESLLARVFHRLTAVVAEPLSEQDTAAAVDSALHLYRRMGPRVCDAVEAVVKKAVRTPGPTLRRALVDSLAAGADAYSDAVIEECFSALRHTRANETDTLRILDSTLYSWDLDGDRDRMLQLLVSLLTQREGTFDFTSLDSLQHKLRDGCGEILGWYAVSLLLTGRHAVCNVVFGLLPHAGGREGLDVDLRPFSLSPRRVLFLARKILGYCLVKKECAAALLLSCLRIVPEQNRMELEDLVFEHFLINYPSAIDWFRNATSRSDVAKESVGRLATRLDAYLTDLERSGPCIAFAPTETERRLQHYKVGDLFRSAHKQAQQGSALLQLISKANLLYGTEAVVYVQPDRASEPVRHEITMSTFKHEVEFPRLEKLDPVGLQRDLGKFCSERPPE